jgi:hypothetical protein
MAQNQVQSKTRNKDHEDNRKPIQRVSHEGIIQHSALPFRRCIADNFTGRSQDEKTARNHEQNRNPVCCVPRQNHFIRH